jgi:hypothetical protein
LVILDDFTHYIWTFPLKLKSGTFTTLSNFFTYVATQFGSTVVDDQIWQGWKNQMFRFPMLDSPVLAVSEHE